MAIQHYLFEDLCHESNTKEMKEVKEYELYHYGKHKIKCIENDQTYIINILLHLSTHQSINWYCA